MIGTFMGLTNRSSRILFLGLPAGAAFVVGMSCSPEITVQEAVNACGPATNVVVTAPPADQLLTEEDDTNPKPGLQLDVAVETELAPGTQLSLSFVPESGELYAWPTSVPVDDDGNVVFTDVTLPEGPSVLRVHRQESCELAATEVPIQVRGPVPCTFQLHPAPVWVPEHEPLLVLHRRHDQDLTTDGAQILTTGYSIPGAAISMVADGIDEPLATGTTAPDGTFSFMTTLGEGVQNLRVFCQAEGRTQPSESVAEELLVDTIAPACTVITPVSGNSVAGSLDQDPASEGTQITATATILGADVDRESVVFAVRTPNGQFLISGSPVDEDGSTSSTIMLWTPGPTGIFVEAEDWAGNACRNGIPILYEP